MSPNPTTNTITITNIYQDITKVEVFDLQGRLMLSQNKILNNILYLNERLFKFIGKKFEWDR